MSAQPLELFFQNSVHNVFAGQLGINDEQIGNYVASVLTEFTRADRLYKICDGEGRPIHSMDRLLAAADPIYGNAPNFDAERRVRKHIGDYTLFLTGMYPESFGRQYQRRHPCDKHVKYSDMVSAGKQSYYIVSQFDLFEYANEAPLFARLSDSFERCTQGLRMVRDEMSRKRMKILPPPAEC